PLPAWATAPAPAEETPSKPLAPSRAALIEPAALSPLKDNGKQRYQRGIIIHRLLQSLPDMPPPRRHAAATAFVQRAAWGLTPEEGEAIVAETLAVLNTPAFAALFAPGSKAEVPLTGLVGKHAVSGQVDRLAVTETDVWIIDYKTNRPPPREAAKVDPAYIFQMATYRAALRTIYPRHIVRCVLLWTDGPFTMELDPARMDGVLRDTGLV
ncbi:MAG: PD-(D/E)XK nuclease family protein, partial [Rhodospirillaceae bacterium]|nr:PD-(D/E)XK nuclease family protein [Rhodospirillaceae bacterium]